MKTLGDLKTELSDRLGYASMAVTDTPTIYLLTSFLQRAQEELYWMYSWEELLRKFSITVTGSAVEYDWPSTTESTPQPLEPRRIISVFAKDDDRWLEMREGISPSDYNLTTTSRPTRYARRNKMEIWPTPDKEYEIKIEGYTKLKAFQANTDVATIDDQLILMMALANAKAHLGQPDANIYAQQVTAMLRRLRAYNHGNRRYVPDLEETKAVAPPKPRMVS